MEPQGQAYTIDSMGREGPPAGQAWASSCKGGRRVHPPGVIGSQQQIGWESVGQGKRQMPVWFKDSITVMSDYILAKQISPLRAALPLLQGQPMWQPGDIEIIMGEMLHKVKNFQYGISECGREQLNLQLRIKKDPSGFEKPSDVNAIGVRPTHLT